MENKKNKDNYLLFEIYNKIYAFPILSLEGVLGNPKIFSLINAPEFVYGAVFSNNQAVPVLDLRQIFNQPDNIYQNKLCVVLVRVIFKHINKLVGLIVDSFLGIKDLEKSEFEKLPKNNESEEFVEGIANLEGKIILLLNLTKIINSKNIIYFLNQIWNKKIQNIIRQNNKKE